MTRCQEPLWCRLPARHRRVCGFSSSSGQQHRVVEPSTPLSHSRSRSSSMTRPLRVALTSLAGSDNSRMTRALIKAQLANKGRFTRQATKIGLRASDRWAEILIKKKRGTLARLEAGRAMPRSHLVRNCFQSANQQPDKERNETKEKSARSEIFNFDNWSLGPMGKPSRATSSWLAASSSSSRLIHGRPVSRRVDKAIA